MYVRRWNTWSSRAADYPVRIPACLFRAGRTLLSVSCPRPRPAPATSSASRLPGSPRAR
jgi:hypothetical protein